MDDFTKECLEESIEALKDIKCYFDMEKCECNDEDGSCLRCGYIGDLQITIQRLNNLIRE